MTALRKPPPIRIKPEHEALSQLELVERAQAERDRAARELIRQREPSSRSHADHEAGFRSCAGY